MHNQDMWYGDQAEDRFLSYRQEVALSLLNVIAGVLSIVGSSLIINWILLKTKHQQHSARPPANANHGRRSRRWVGCCWGSSSDCMSVTKTTTPYDRIMLGLSLFDILYSINFVLRPFLVPLSTTAPVNRTHRIWSVGNASTCNLLGFVAQFAGGTSIYYNFTLSVYYYMTVRLGIPRSKFAKSYELCFHLVPTLFFGLGDECDELFFAYYWLCF